MPRLLLAAIAAALTTLAFAASANADCPTENCGPGGGTTFPTPATTITFGPDATTGDTTPTFSFTSSLSFSRFECRWGPVNDPWSSAGAFACASPFTPAQQADGDYHLYVRACRDYEHPDTGEEIVKCDESPSHYGYLLDTKGPTVGWGTSPADGVRTNAAVTYKFTGATAYRCSVGTVVLGDCTDTFEITPQMLVGDGPKNVRVQGRDAWGNWGPVQLRQFVWDTTGPPITITAPTLTNDRTPQLQWTAPHDGGSAYAMTCKIDDLAADCGGDSVTTAFELGDGTHTLRIDGTDGLGNASSKEHAFVVDATAPVVGGFAWNASTKTLTYAVDDSSVDVTCKVGPASFRPCENPIDAGSLAPGGHAIIVRAVDRAQNTGEATHTVTIPTPPAENPGGDKPGTGGGSPPPPPVLAAPVPGPPATVSVATPRRTTSTASPSKAKRRAACKTSRKKAAKKGKAKANASAKKKACTTAKKKKVKKTRKR